MGTESRLARRGDLESQRETGSPQFDVSPDGTHFVMVEADPEAKPTRIQFVLNWVGEPRRLSASGEPSGRSR